MRSNCPFYNKHGILVFPYRAILDRAFIWPSPLPKKFRNSVLEIPREFREFHRNNEGILLSIGPGYQSNDGKWHPTSTMLKPGLIVNFDITVPWSVLLDGCDGKKHKVIICTEQDIHGIIRE